MGVEEVTTDQLGMQYRVVDGQELVAIWVPLKKDEVQELTKKALETNAPFPDMVANAAKSWLSGGELSLEDLENVAGGTSRAALSPQVQKASLQALNLYNTALQASGAQYNGMEEMLDKIGKSTVMCGW
jgi:hypothetical protein